MTIEFTEEERQLMGFFLVCALDDYEAIIKKQTKKGIDISKSREQLRKLEQFIYTKIIPEAWCGSKPSYWK